VRLEPRNLSGQRKAIGILLVLITAASAVAYSFSDPLIEQVNDTTRANLSEQVSNMPCGPGAPNRTRESVCPGDLECYRGPINTDGPSFDRERVGVNISGGRCVTPTYIEHYCGIWEGAPKSTGYPPFLGPCIDRSLSPIGYITALLDEDNLYGRITNPDQNGAELIRSHGLKLAIKDPDAENVTR